jgi:hypothetical protein
MTTFSQKKKLPLAEMINAGRVKSGDVKIDSDLKHAG